MLNKQNTSLANQVQKILYVSTLCSTKVWDYAFSTSDSKPGQAVQKFHRLLAVGLATHKHACNIETLSSIPVVSESHKKRMWFIKKDAESGIAFNYIPFINLPFIKHAFHFCYTFFFVLFWGWRNKRSKPVVVCDILNMTISLAALYASKLNRTKITAIVTDLPGLMVSSQSRKSIKSKVYAFFVTKNIRHFSGYVLLTQQMNAVVNPGNRPYIIMEGLIDKNMADTINTLDNKSKERILLYAGGIYEIYGINDLIKGFMMLEEPTVRLHIYGPGPMAKEMPEYCRKDIRIEYFGIVPNKQVVEAQLKATLLINPRPATLELSKFSFPSKNMEYMASGTPLLTTPLPGMPVEYHDYVYLICNDSSLGIHEELRKLLYLSPEELHNMGAKAKKFVLEKKNNETQGKRLLKFLNESA